MSEEKKLWYAVLKDENSRDFSVGSYDEDEAEEISKRPEYDYDNVRIAQLFFREGKEPIVFKIERPFWILSHIVW